MGDVVLVLPVRDGEEAQRFGSFLNLFLQDCSPAAAVWARDNDAPYIMVRSEPQAGIDLKTLIFQENAVAQAFRSGWDAAIGPIRKRLAG